MKVWITKYALTSGINERELECDANECGRIYFKGEYSGYNKDEWHRTKYEAIFKAEKMRIKKIASLEKQINKLKLLRFE